MTERKGGSCTRSEGQGDCAESGDGDAKGMAMDAELKVEGKRNVSTSHQQTEEGTTGRLTPVPAGEDKHALGIDIAVAPGS